MTAPAPMETTKPLLDNELRIKALHYTSWGALIICPILIALPPRKLDLYTFGLMTCTFIGGNQVSKEQRGASIIEIMGSRVQDTFGSALPPKARDLQLRLKEEKEAQNRLLREVERKKAESLTEKKGLLQKVWMGREGDDWKTKRDQREKEALEEGRGYGGLIVDQILEVWNWGKDTAEDDKKSDQKAIDTRNEEEASKGDDMTK